MSAKLRKDLDELEGLFHDYKKEFKPKEDEPVKIDIEKPKENKQKKDKPNNNSKPKEDMTYLEKNGTTLKRQTMTPVSDIKLNNQLLSKLVYLGWAFLIYIIIMTVYIIYNNVANNIIATIWG